MTSLRGERPFHVVSPHRILAEISSVRNSTLKRPLPADSYALTRENQSHTPYPYHEMKYIVEGEFDISDETSGQKVHAVAGDVIYFPKGSNITFASETTGLAFYTSQRLEGKL
ncbi:hypothetical protein BT96DRAFT_458351 [Gymnopus androsaceus JB14]|uniref:(S)-ureidoglycine aminohydrolase cupin domain-containing protein n=1 Tax=Gymnopus androsaceus JB14 TaxID=1447944 RepID=A0A6A4IN09_9AGAR|nr:hypothetical protein BT96DRAFT_458351 [Gymnopus androsaceus JB14]